MLTWFDAFHPLSLLFSCVLFALNIVLSDADGNLPQFFFAELVKPFTYVCNSQQCHTF